MADVEPYEMGAAVTVLMCWPNVREEAKRMEQHVRLCAWAVRKLVADEPGGELRPWAIKPLYAFSSGALVARIFRFDPAELFDLCRPMQADSPSAWRLLLSNEFVLARQFWPELGLPHPRTQFRYPLIDAFRIVAEFERASLVMRHLARARAIVDRPKLLEALRYPASLSFWFKPDELIEICRWIEYASFSSPALTDLMLGRDVDGIRALPKGYAPRALAHGHAIGAAAGYHDDPQVRAAMIRVFARQELPHVERRKGMLRNDEVLRWYGMTAEVLPIIALEDARVRFPTGHIRKVPGAKKHGHVGLNSRAVIAQLGSAMRRRADPVMERKVRGASGGYLRNSKLSGHSSTLEANVRLGLKLALAYLPPADRLGAAARFDPSGWKDVRRDAALWRAMLDPHHHGRLLLRRHPAAAQLIVTIRAMRRVYGKVFNQLRWSPEVERVICDMAVGLSPISVDPYIAFAIYSLDRNPALQFRLGRAGKRRGYGKLGDVRVDRVGTIRPNRWEVPVTAATRPNFGRSARISSFLKAVVCVRLNH